MDINIERLVWLSFCHILKNDHKKEQGEYQSMGIIARNIDFYYFLNLLMRILYQKLLDLHPSFLIIHLVGKITHLFVSQFQ